jgi:transcriptional regulator with XRE-family HTH domain
MEKRSVFKWRRILLGMSQDQVAKRADVDQTQVSRLERGFSRHVPIEAQHRIARVLGLQLKEKSKKA